MAVLNRICCIPACFILFVFIVSSSVAYHGSDTQRILNAIDHRKFDRTGEIQPNIVVHSYGDKTEIGETSATSDKYQRLFDHDGNLAAVVENGVITHEKYNKKFGMHADAPLNGMSITKSAAASIIGTLLCNGKIDSLSDNAGKYSDFLNKTPYSNITIENILRMASGVSSVSGDGQGKFIPMAYGFGKWKGKGSIRKAMNLLKKPHVEQGKRFHYHQADATALSILSHEITGESLRKTFYERVYKNYTDAGRLHWHADSEGYSQTFSGLVMRPQDWAFFGDFILREIKAKSCLGNFLLTEW